MSRAKPKKKQLTRVRAEALLRRKFGHVQNDGSIDGSMLAYLCCSIPQALGHDWAKYWHQINTGHCRSIANYFSEFPSDEEVSFLRLLTAHIFIRESYK
jgi:hypothetical protein